MPAAALVQGKCVRYDIERSARRMTDHPEEPFAGRGRTCADLDAEKARHPVAERRHPVGCAGRRTSPRHPALRCSGSGRDGGRRRCRWLRRKPSCVPTSRSMQAQVQAYIGEHGAAGSVRLGLVIERALGCRPDVLDPAAGASGRKYARRRHA